MADVITRHFSSRRKSSLDGKGIGMALHLGLPHAHRHSAEQQQEIREAKRFLKDTVRSDWDYPALPKFDETPSRGAEKEEEGHEGDAGSGDEVAERIAGFKLHSPSNHDREGGVKQVPEDLLFEPVQWRERVYSTEESSDDESIATDVSNGSKKSTYKFEGPDSVGLQISDTNQARKRKLQERLDQEVTWNDGLAHWLARRDVWCGAHTAEQVRTLESRRQVSTDSSSASPHSTPRTSTSLSSDEEQSAPEPADTPSTTPEPVPSSSGPALSPVNSPAPPSEILVPVAPPLLPNHPIRKRITPDVYPEIYSKIIVQSRTPSVPINLRTMTRALVQGWKDDGEWPPKQAPPEKSIGRKRGKGEESTLKSGVKAVGRVLRITGGGDGTAGKDKDKG